MRKLNSLKSYRCKDCGEYFRVFQTAITHKCIENRTFKEKLKNIEKCKEEN